MDTPVVDDAARAPASEPTLNVGQRAIAVFLQPANAWSGLREHAQWWFPLLVLGLFAALFSAVLYHRAVLPMMLDAWQDQVANGNMPAETARKLEQFFGGPQGLVISMAQQFVIVPVITLIMGLLVWLGVGFILGRPLTYRLSLEAASWAGLISIPAQILTGVVAWTRESMKGVHVGFGLLLPETETPTRLGVFLGGVLDALGPLSLWYLTVLVLGAATLSEAPRKQAALVLGALYFAGMLLLAGLGAMFMPMS